MADNTEKLIQPLPWSTERGASGLWYVRDSNGFVVFGEVTEDEAEHIVKAVNHHAELVEALQKIADSTVSVLGHARAIATANAVLAKVNQ